MKKSEWRKRARWYKRQYRKMIVICRDRVNHEAAVLNKVEELLQDLVRADTELARVQGVCDDTQAQVLKHSATIVNLRERENEALKESEGLLAWQRRVREAWKEHLSYAGQNEWNLRQAIEAEPKEET